MRVAEYNHSVPGALKNAMDQAYKEWNRKPMTALAYGGAGGARALEHLRAWGFHDQFRKFEQGAGFYTWWDYREGAYPRNAGLRIDHVWASRPLSERATACVIEREERARPKASDHVPVIVSYLVD